MILAILLLALLGVQWTIQQEAASRQPIFKGSQSAAEQNPLLREAIDNRYTLQRIEFVGNETTRDYVLRRRVYLREGDFFSRRNLTKSLVKLNRLKIIYPVK